MEEEIREIIESDSWKETYKQICIAAQLQKDYTSLTACAEENRSLNRYGDVHPYDHSRVTLKMVKNGRSDYINASLVKNDRAKRRYILAQGPLCNTIGHFWSMVWHEKSKAILMLNKLMEKGIRKCEQYWPPHPGKSLLCPDVNIKVENLQSESRNDYILTNLRITDLTSDEERMVLHFQYIAWPDFGVPRCPDTFLNFLQAVRQTGSLDEDAGPPVVHCSAGIGRSGTFCLVDTSLVLIAKEGPSSVILKDILLDLRSYRMGLIQTWEQLKFSYLAIVSGAKRDNQLSPNFLDDHDVSITPTVVNKDEDASSPPPLPPPRTDSLKNNTAAKLTNGATHNQSKLVELDNEENQENTVKTKTDKSATILNCHKMEERKREVREIRRRYLKEEKKQKTMNLLEEIKRKQRESEKQKIRRKYLYENMFSFCVGVMMVVAGVAFYYYDGGST